ncbi:hypothetical protein CPT_Stills16 [Bacillus phage Stills]|uniref:Uncharacterized protein n=1 Tax=Bacillus phage Stills TaxID=1610833 RepID=A0A0E3T699_9CAUD|nr:hypothetical protein CPT_Stills16 [Bacillus phage Stills]AKC02644.1 hypothetical protein CPT_Stills16 [Bacillus phage Stills]
MFDWDYVVFAVVRMAFVMGMGFLFHLYFSEKGFWKSALFLILALFVLDIIISLEDIRP